MKLPNSAQWIIMKLVNRKLNWSSNCFFFFETKVYIKLCSKPSSYCCKLYLESHLVIPICTLIVCTFKPTIHLDYKAEVAIRNNDCTSIHVILWRSFYTKCNTKLNPFLPFKFCWNITQYIFSASVWNDSRCWAGLYVYAGGCIKEWLKPQWQLMRLDKESPFSYPKGW